MREVATSVISYMLAQGLYTGQQVAKMSGVSKKLVNPKNPPAPGPNGEAPRTFSSFLYKKTKETVEKFGDPAAVVFIAGDEYQSKAVDFVFDLFSPSTTLNPSYWLKFSDHLLTQGLLAADATIGSQESLFAQQAKNTRYIFTLVRNNPEKLGIPKTGPVDLSIYSWSTDPRRCRRRTASRRRAGRCPPVAPRSPRSSRSGARRWREGAAPAPRS